MELDLGNLNAHLKLDDSQYAAVLGRNLQTTNRELETMNQKVSAIGTTLHRAFGFAAGYLGVRALKREIMSLVAAARDAYEAENLFVVSMGKYEQAAKSWSQELQRALGLSEYEARKNIGTYNVMLTSMGMTEEAAYEMSKGLVQLAYDMSSFYNLRPEDAFFKLQAAISGETEPLRRLGINIKAARMEEYALQQGWIKGKEKLSDLGKTYATYGAIIEATRKAQGDLERTASAAANMERRLQSELQRTKIELGTRLLPAYQHVLSTVSSYLQANLDDITSWANGTISAVGAVIKVYAELQNWFAKIMEKHDAPDIIEQTVNERLPLGKTARERYDALVEEYPKLLPKEPISYTYSADAGPYGSLEAVTEPEYTKIVAQVENEREALRQQLRREIEAVWKDRETLRAQRLSGNYNPNPPAADLMQYNVLAPDVNVDMTKGDSDKKQVESAQKVADALADMAAERVRTTATMYDQMGKYDEEWYQARLAQLMMERREHEETLNDSVAAEKWYVSQVAQLRDEAAEKQLEKLEKQQQASERIMQANAQLYAGLEGMTGAYEAQVILLDHQRASYEKIGADVRAINAWYERQNQLIEIQALKNSQNFSKGFQAGIMEMEDELKTLGELGADTARTMRDGFVSSFADALMEVRKLEDALKSVGRAMARQGIEFGASQIWQIAARVVGGMINTAPTTAGTAQNSPAANAQFDYQTGGFHKGGVPVYDSPAFTRMIPTGVFATAIRAHSGIGPGERPAVIREDEGVFTQGQMRAMGNWRQDGEIVALLRQLVQKESDMNVALVDTREDALKKLNTRKGRRQIYDINRRMPRRY